MQMGVADNSNNFTTSKMTLLKKGRAEAQSFQSNFVPFVVAFFRKLKIDSTEKTADSADLRRFLLW